MRDKDNNSNNNFVHRNTGEKIGFGLLLIIAGILFIFKNIDMLPKEIEDVFISWQMLLIGIGLVKFVFDSNKFVSSILILVGGFFLLPEIFDFKIDFIDVFWPGILIVVGLMLVFKNKRKIKTSVFGFKDNQHSSQSFIEDVNIFGGGDKVIDSEDFKGGTINNVFGGSTLDLRDCKIKGDSATIEVNCVFGGSELLIPDNWVVVIKVNSVFGGFSNKRKNRNPVNDNEKKTLFIVGSAIFGGGEIK